MKYQRQCECCGQTVTAYSHNINGPLASAFIALTERYLESKQPVNINKECGLDHNQIANFQKLQHFLIVKRIEGAGWVPTPVGLSFYYGECRVLNPAGSFGNRTLSDDHEAWKTHKKPRIAVSLKDLIDGPWEYKKRPEYQAERSYQSTLF